MKERKMEEMKAGKRILSGFLTGIVALTLLVGIPLGKNGVVDAARRTLKNPSKNSEGVVTWDCVYFGSYPQSDATGKTKDPIKWRVLSVNGNDAFLMADCNLDCQPYNTTEKAITWEISTIRSWLNGYGAVSNSDGVDYSTDNFIDRAFTASEQNAIILSDVVNTESYGFSYGTTGGNDTKDKVFLLSFGEMTNSGYGFSADDDVDSARRRKNSSYAKEQGAKNGVTYSDNGTYWLRSPGCTQNELMTGEDDGMILPFGYVNVRFYAVCPALHLNLSSTALWTYAGTVSSDGSSTGCMHENTEIKGKKEACTGMGYTGDTYCSDCGMKLKAGNTVSAKDHQWNNGVIIKQATEKESGVKTFTCTACGETKTETVTAVKGQKITVSSTKGIYKVTASDAKNAAVTYTGTTNTKAKTIKVPATVKFGGVTYKVTAIAAGAFKNNKNVTTVTIGSNVTTIGKNAFYGCSKLTKVTIGKGVKTIGTGAFRGCSKLKTVSMGTNVTSINARAFYKCTSLTKVTIPAKVSKIGKQAFYGCKKLKTITVKTKKLTSKKVGSKAFKGIYSKASIKVPKGKFTSYKKILKARGVSSKATIKK